MLHWIIKNCKIRGPYPSRIKNIDIIGKAAYRAFCGIAVSTGKIDCENGKAYRDPEENPEKQSCDVALCLSNGDSERNADLHLRTGQRKVPHSARKAKEAFS